jgi:polygalacturonase
MKHLLQTIHCISPATAVAVLAASFVVPQALANKICDVHQMGAIGDGHTKDTAAIQKAIDACSVPGGGTVHFAAGTYLSAPLDWKSHVKLQLDAGATLLALQI